MVSRTIPVICYTKACKINYMTMCCHRVERISPLFQILWESSGIGERLYLILIQSNLIPVHWKLNISERHHWEEIVRRPPLWFIQNIEKSSYSVICDGCICATCWTDTKYQSSKSLIFTKIESHINICTHGSWLRNYRFERERYTAL